MLSQCCGEEALFVCDSALPEEGEIRCTKCKQECQAMGAQGVLYNELWKILLPWGVQNEKEYPKTAKLLRKYREELQSCFINEIAELEGKK